MEHNLNFYFALVFLQVFNLIDSTSILTILPRYNNGSTNSTLSFRMELGAVVETINRDLGRQLSLEFLDIGDICSVDSSLSESQSHDMLIRFVNSTVYQGKNISGVIELCHGTVSTVSDLSHTRLGLVKFALSSLFLAQSSHNLVLRQVVRAWYSFMNYLEWTQFGIIADTTNAYYFQLDKLLIEEGREHGVNITMNIQRCCTAEILELSHLPNIVFISASAQNSIRLLYTLHKMQQLWPRRVLSESKSDNVLKECNVSIAQQGVIFLKYQHRPDDVNSLLDSGITYGSYTAKVMQIRMKSDKISLEPDAYTNRLYDLVLATALKLNSSYMLEHDSFTFRGAQGIAEVNSNGWVQSNVKFVQRRGTYKACLAVYNISDEIHFTNPSFKEVASSYNPHILVIGGSLLYTMGLAIEIALGYLLTTLLLVLLVVFRNEPEVKSTSFTLSLLMFAGCYLTLLYLSLLLHFDQPSDALHILHLNNLCRSQPWFSGLGIPLTLAIVVLLIKMLRVYHIFTRLIPGAVGKLCSDLFLMVYVLILLIPNILIHIVWSAIDEFTVSIEYVSFHTDIIEVKKQCVSKYFYHWLSILSGNLAFLLLALLVVAVKSRKIRLTHFKDTKKANALVFAANVALFLTLSYWLFLRGINAENHITHLPLHFGHSAFVLLCQVLLFAPKVLPPLQRYILNIIKHNPQSNNDGSTSYGVSNLTSKTFQ